MTRLMEQAIARLRSVPEDRQDEVARFLLSELQEDERWSATTAAHVDKLRSFVDGIIASDDKGECDPLDPDRL